VAHASQAAVKVDFQISRTQNQQLASTFWVQRELFQQPVKRAAANFSSPKAGTKLPAGAMNRAPQENQPVFSSAT
jgi:hypothetical protein